MNYSPLRNGRCPAVATGETVTRGMMEDILYIQTISYDNLMAAAIDVSRGKWGRHEWLEYFTHLEERVLDLHNRLVWGIYRPSPTVDFYVYEPKKRAVARPVLDDRIVQHAIMNTCERFFARVTNPCSHACLKGRGVESAVHAWQRAMRSALGLYGKRFLVVSIDFKSYYETVDLVRVKALLTRHIPSPGVVSLISSLIDSYVELDEYGVFPHKGLAIGNVLNQHCANLNLFNLDCEISDGFGLGRRYVRYMDDLRMAVGTRGEAEELMAHVAHHAETVLHQSLSQKKCHIKPFKGHDHFLGFDVHPHRLCPEMEKVKKMERRLTSLEPRWLDGEITDMQMRSSVSTALDYLAKTGSWSPCVERIAKEVGAALP